jgi:hypothetical protein
MRKPLLLISTLFCLCACENRITDVGKQFEDNTRFVEVQRFEIEKSSTIRLDSFPTSVVSGLANDTLMVIGRIKDLTTGVTSSTPFFEVHPTSNSIIGFGKEFVYDSLTLVLNNLKLIAGDTTVAQQFYLYRLKEVPGFDEQRPFYYNTASVPLGDSVGTLNFLPQKEYLTSIYFKLGDKWGEEIFNLIAANDKSLYSPWEFLDYFKGLAIVPDQNNSALLTAHPRFELRCYYHMNSGADGPRWITLANRNAAGAGGVLDFFTFSHHAHVPASDLVGVSEQNPMPFDRHNYAVIQGVNGYMVKLQLPFIQENNRYRTIVKAQVALKPLLENYENIPEPRRLHLYECNAFGMPLGVIAEGFSDPTMLPENKRFIFDITDYYRERIRNTSSTDITFLVGLPGYVIPVFDALRFIGGDVNTSFGRMIVREIPELFIHYIQFK